MEPANRENDNFLARGLGPGRHDGEIGAQCAGGEKNLFGGAGEMRQQQLRGRIARGKYQGYCFLVSEADTADSSTRLHAMEQTSDGFKIAEVDFEMRGPGDALGTRQSGSLPLQIADLVRDHDLLVETRAAAQSLLKTEAIDRPEFAPLKLKVLDRFGQLMDLQRGG